MRRFLGVALVILCMQFAAQMTPAQAQLMSTGVGQGDTGPTGGGGGGTVTFDALSASYVNVNGGVTLTMPLTVGGGSGRVIAAMLFFNQTTLPTIIVSTWNTTQTFTAVPGATSSNGNDGNSSVIYCLAAPASGAHNAIFTWTGAQEAHGVVISFAGANATTPCIHGNGVGTGTVAGPATITITSATGHQVVATAGQNCQVWGAISGTGNVQDTSTGPAIGVATSYSPGAATVSPTFAFTGTCPYDVSGIDVTP